MINYPDLEKQFDWEKLYPINCNDIKWGLSFAFDPTNNEWNKVYDGDWDKRLPITEDFVYYSVMSMIKDKVPFSETALYKSFSKKIAEGRICYNCNTPEKFLKRGEKILKTFNKIKNEGFKTQKQLESENYHVAKVYNKLIDSPGVTIDRDGRYLYHNGNHRLPMFKYLGINNIQIKVNARHKEWVDFLNYVRKLSLSIWGENKIYQPVNHIDFSDYHSEWGHYRYQLIKSYLNKKDKTLLDIGSLWGFFASSFEKDGLQCTAVESNETFAYIMNKLRIANDQSFKIFNKSIFNLKKKKFDVVLALNIFHHFLKSKSSYDKFKVFLNNLDIGTMYFQSHRCNEKQMTNAYRNFGSKEFVEFIIKNSCLTNYQLIGEEKQRKIYKLWKD